MRSNLVIEPFNDMEETLGREMMEIQSAKVK